MSSFFNRGYVANRSAKNKPVKAAMVLAVALAFTGCGDVNRTAEEYLQSAQDSRLAGNLNGAVLDLKNALQKDPNSAPARYMLGEIYLEVGDGASAEKELQRAQEAGMGQQALVFPLARAWLLQRQFDRVLDELALPQSQDGVRLAVLNLHGKAYLGLGRPDAAQVVFEEARSLDATSQAAIVGLARSAMAQQDTERATELSVEAEAIDPENIDFLSLKGDLAFRNRDFEAAESTFQALVARRPQSFEYKLGLAWAQIGAEKYEAAEKNLAPIRRALPTHVLTNYLSALTAFNVKDLQGTRNFADRVLAEEGRHASSLLLAGSASYDLEELEQALNYMTRFVALAPTYEPGLKLLAATQMQMGQNDAAAATLKPLMIDAREIEDEQLLRLVAAAALQSGDIQAGRNYIEQAVVKAPDDAGLRMQLGLTRISLGDVEQGLADLGKAVEQDPQLDSAEVAIAMNLISLGRYDEALEAARRIQSSIPDLSLGYVLEGNIYDKMGDQEAAQAAFRKALDINPAAFDAARNLALIEVRNNRLEEGRQIFHEFLEANPENLPILAQLAQLDARVGDQSAMETTLTRMVEVAPENVDARVLLGRFYLLGGKPQQAVDTVQDVFQQYADHPALLEIYGRAQLTVGRTDEALRAFSLWVGVDSDNLVAHYWQASAFNRDRRYPDAIEAINRSLSINPNFMQGQLLKGEIAATQENEGALTEAIAALAQNEQAAATPQYKDLRGALAFMQGQINGAIDIWEDGFAQAPSTDRLVRLAAAEARLGRNGDAIVRLDQWLQEYPDDKISRVLLNKLYVSTERFDDAKLALGAMLERYPDDWDAHNDLAWINYQQGDVATAMSHAEEAVDLAPNQPAVLDTYGRILLADGNAAKAVVSLERASNGLPDSPSTHLQLAKAYAEIDRENEAVVLLRRLLNGGADFAERSEAQALLDQLTQEE